MITPLAGLAGVNAFDTLLPAMRNVPLKARVVVVTSVATGTIVDEGQPKQISELVFDADTLVPFKAVAIVVVSNELLELSTFDAFALLRSELQRGVVQATDAKFIDVLTTGISALPSSGNMRDDVATLLGAVTTDAQSKLYLLTTAVIANQWRIAGTDAGATFPNGSPAGIPVVPSDGVADGEIVLVDASQVAAGNSGVTLDASTDALLDMAGGSSPTFSLWQKDCTGVRCERWFSCARLRDEAVAKISGASYPATA